MMHRKHHGQQPNRQYHVGHRSGHGNDQPLPAWMLQKLAFVVAAAPSGRSSGISTALTPVIFT